MRSSFKPNIASADVMGIESPGLPQNIALAGEDKVWL